MPTEPPRGEAALLARVQADLLRVPAAVPVATTLSHVGEHALGWMGICAAGAMLRPRRRTEWISAGIGTFGAHAASVVIKRIVRRTRPDHPAIAVGVGTPSRLSFPSSHATSTTAFALLAGHALGGVAGKVLPAGLIPTMQLSRLVLGVHYPTDVAAGTALGVACAALTRRVVPARVARAERRVDARWPQLRLLTKDAQ